MKEYIKPELIYVSFATEEITDLDSGNTDTTSDVNDPDAM